jgi:hypothetical protein
MSDNAVKILTVADILAAQEQPKPVKVPEWGGAVNVYHISEEEHERAIQAGKIEGSDERDPVAFNDHLWAASLRCTVDEAHALRGKSVRARRRVERAINAINGWTGAAMKEDEALFREG